jgi:MFS family permease
VAALWVAVVLPAARWIAGIVAAAIYAAEYVLTHARYRRAPRPRRFTPAQTALFYGAHVGAINFAFAIGSSGIAAMRGQRALFIVANAVTLVILYAGYTFIEPWQLAWGCYPTGKRKLAQLDLGMCPTYTDYYGPRAPCPSDSNKGSDNLVCARYGDTSPSCTAEPDLALPGLWHMASLIATTSFTLGISLVRFKIREIERAETNK